MVIKLDETFQERLLEHGLTSTHLQNLQRLLDYMASNKLFFLAATTFYDYLFKNHSSYFSENVRGLLYKLVNESFVDITEAKNVDPLIVICDDYSIPTVKDGCTYLPFCRLPFEFSPYLCCENPEDAEYYLEVYRKSSINKRDIHICLDGFGGATVKTFLEKWQNQNKIFITVVDSDIKYPGGNRGTTATKVVEFYTNNKPMFSDFCVLDVHEKENTYPICTMNRSYFSKSMKEVVGFIMTLSNKNDYFDFFDFKDGINKKLLESTDIKLKSFYDPIIAFIKKNKLEIIDKNNPKIVDGIGSNFISKFTKKGLEIRKFEGHLTNRQLSTFTKINNLIFKFGYVYNHKIN